MCGCQFSEESKMNFQKRAAGCSRNVVSASASDCFMLSPLGLFAKWTSSYFPSASFDPCLLLHASALLCAEARLLQFVFVVLLYGTKYTSSIRPPAVNVQSRVRS